MPQESVTPPSVHWAQRKEEVYLTFDVESKDPTIKIEKDSVYFKGVCAPDNKPHEVTIQLFADIVPDDSAFVNKGRCVQMVLRKEKKDDPYWPSLTKDKKKPHYLKIDFNKWQDEDEDDEAGGDAMPGMGGMGGMPGMGGMGGMGGAGGFDLSEMLRNMNPGGEGADGAAPGKPSFDDLSSDSDDENLPDLE